MELLVVPVFLCLKLMHLKIICTFPFLIKSGNELPAEFLQTLLKMTPTSEEELKLRLFNGELSRLGPAERFLKALVDIPFAFKRLEALLFMCTFQEDIGIVKESFTTLEVANQLSNLHHLYVFLICCSCLSH